MVAHEDLEPVVRVEGGVEVSVEGSGPVGDGLEVVEEGEVEGGGVGFEFHGFVSVDEVGGEGGFAQALEGAGRHGFLAADRGETDHEVEVGGKTGAVFGKGEEHLHGALGVTNVGDFLLSFFEYVLQARMHII